MAFVTPLSSRADPTRIDGAYDVALLDAAASTIQLAGNYFAQNNGLYEFFDIIAPDGTRHFGAPLDRVVFSEIRTSEILLTGGNILQEMAQVASDMYRDPNPSNVLVDGSVVAQRMAARNWRGLSSLELGMHRSSNNLFDPQLSFRMREGHYSGFKATDDGRARADAYAGMGLVGGKRTLVVAFLGTDQIPSDMLDYPDFSRHYAKFQPFVEGLRDYIADPANAVQQVVVTGHSLGGAMVQHFIQENTFPGSISIRGFTFGSPGADSPASNNTDHRILNLIQNNDYVTRAADVANAADMIAGLTMLYPAGSIQLLAALYNGLYQSKVRGGADMDVGFPNSGNGEDSHSIDDYTNRASLLLWNAANDQQSIIYDTAAAAALRSNGPFTTALAVTFGDGLPNRLSADLRQYTDAGEGDDRIVLLANRFSNQPTRMIGGGWQFTQGDWLVLPNISINDVVDQGNGNWTIARAGGGTPLADIRGVEHIIASDGYRQFEPLFGTNDVTFTTVTSATAPGGSYQAPAGINVVRATNFYGQVIAENVTATNPTLYNYGTVIYGAAGSVLEGRMGNDVIMATAPNPQAGPSSHMAFFLGDLGMPSVNGALLNGWSGTDTLVGGAANDVLVVDELGDLAIGGQGYDRVVLRGPALASRTPFEVSDDIEAAILLLPAAIALSDAAQIVTGSTGNDRFFARAGNDTINAGAGADLVDGGDGADTIDTNAGDDVVFGWAGSDSIEGGDGVDLLDGGLGADVLDGGADNDTMIAATSDGNDTLTGGNGFDVLDFSAVGGVVQVNQFAGTVTGSAGNDTLTDIFEQVIGTAFGDVLAGGHGINVLDGNGGNDQLYGNGGQDLLRGGDGDDTFFFSANDGNDTLLGGNGFDVLDYSTLTGVVQVNQFAGTTTGSANNDTLQDIFEQVVGSNFGDVLAGGNGINGLKGNGGADQLFGNGGQDYTSGGDGNDTITMGTGDDTHDFRNGEDVDTILDFVAGGTEDRIDLRFYSGLGFTTFAALQSSGRLSTVSGHAELTLNGGDRVIFNNVASHTLLTAADFTVV